MSKNTKNLGTSVKPQLLQEVDSIRGEVPASRIVERALRRFLLDVKTGKVEVLTLEGEDQEGKGRGVLPTKRSATSTRVT